MEYIEKLCLEAGIGGEQLISFAGETFLLPNDIEVFESVCSDCVDAMDAAEEGYNIDQYSKYSQAMKKASKLAKEAKKLSKTGTAHEVKEKMKECINALKDARKEVADAMKNETKKESTIGTVLYYLQQMALYAVTIAAVSAPFTMAPSFKLGLAMNNMTSTQFIAKNVAAGAAGAGLGTLVGHIFTLFANFTKKKAGNTVTPKDYNLFTQQILRSFDSLIWQYENIARTYADRARSNRPT